MASGGKQVPRKRQLSDAPLGGGIREMRLCCCLVWLWLCCRLVWLRPCCCLGQLQLRCCLGLLLSRSLRNPVWLRGPF